MARGKRNIIKEIYLKKNSNVSQIQDNLSSLELNKDIAFQRLNDLVEDIDELCIPVDSKEVQFRLSSILKMLSTIKPKNTFKREASILRANIQDELMKIITDKVNRPENFMTKSLKDSPKSSLVLEDAYNALISYENIVLDKSRLLERYAKYEKLKKAMNKLEVSQNPLH